jgi:hypothetical protein
MVTVMATAARIARNRFAFFFFDIMTSIGVSDVHHDLSIGHTDYFRKNWLILWNSQEKYHASDVLWRIQLTRSA